MVRNFCPGKVTICCRQSKTTAQQRSMMFVYICLGHTAIMYQLFTTPILDRQLPVIKSSVAKAGAVTITQIITMFSVNTNWCSVLRWKSPSQQSRSDGQKGL